MTPFQFLFLRASVAVIVGLIVVNRNLKFALYDSFGPGDKWKLVAKIPQSLIGVYFGFTSLKYFPVSYCTSMRSLSPFFAIVLSAVFLKEAATCREVFIITIVSTLSLLFVFTANLNEEEEDELLYGLTPGTKVLAWSSLFLTPLSIAIGNVLLRALKGLHENTVSLYGNFSGLVVFLTLVLATG